MLESHPTLRFRDIARFKRKDPWSPLESARMRYTYNARGAIYQLLRSLPADRGPTILLPAFHCFALVEPVLRAGYRPVFYRIRKDLSLDQEDICGKLSRDVAAVIVINYCGFPADIDDILQLRKKYNFYVLEDWAHSFLKDEEGTLTGDKGDVAIFSFYKLAPSYAGGGLRINAPDLACVESNERLSIKQSIVAMKRLLEQLIDNSKGGVLRSTFHYVEKKRVALRRGKLPSLERTDAPVPDSYLFRDELASVKMPWFARAILRASDVRTLVSARRRNFEILNDHLQESTHLKKVFKSLPDNVCPWAYPVLVKNRYRYDHILRSRGVPVFTFGELLHPALYNGDSDVVDAAEFLSKNLMMIPLHQNLDSERMLSICEKVNALFQSVVEGFTGEVRCL